MKTLIFVLSLLTLIQSASAVTLANVRDRVDNFRTNIWPTIVAKQNAYYTNHGHYWQGLITHTIIPNHTTSDYADALADLAEHHPTDQPEDWTKVFAAWSNTSIPCAIKIDVGTTPYDGDGWTVTIYVGFNGTIYTRSAAVNKYGTSLSSWQVYAPEE